MENLVFVPRQQVFRECSELIGSYVQETGRLQGEITLHEKHLRRIDPALVNEPRFYSDDWAFIQFVKTIYYLIQRYFSEKKIGQHQSEIARIQGEIQTRKGVEDTIVLAFNQAFRSDPVVQSGIEVKGQFDTFARFYDEIDFSEETNAFLDREEIQGSSLGRMTHRCQHCFYDPPSSFESCISGSEEEEFQDCNPVTSQTPVIEEEEEEKSPPRGQPKVTIETLFPNTRLYDVANHFLPLSRIQSIEVIKEQTYCLTFEGHLVGRIERLEEGFSGKLEGIIRRRLREGSDLLIKLREDYPLVGTFLDTIGVMSLEDMTKVVYWQGLLGAWSSAQRSYCHLPERVVLRVMETKIEILEGTFRAGVHITDYHLIKQNLLNRVFQGALYTCLRGLGLVTWNGSTQKPLHATFSINAFEWFAEEEGIFLHVTSERENELGFEYDESWQQPQNFPQKELDSLDQNPWKQIYQEELGLIRGHFVWKATESQ
ncbi:MAG: hypothetical protein H7A41_05695 [Chlamydiales bacterium]|nr:hypothetical protein [Chlamydiales bacterium]